MNVMDVMQKILIVLICIGFITCIVGLGYILYAILTFFKFIGSKAVDYIALKIEHRSKKIGNLKTKSRLVGRSVRRKSVNCDKHITEDEKEKNEILAIHEAGHLLIGYLFDKKVNEISFKKLGTSLARVCFSDEILWYEKDLIQQVMIRHGGIIAEKVYKNDFTHFSMSCSSDIEEITDMLKNFYSKNGVCTDGVFIRAKDDDAVFNKCKETAKYCQTCTKKILTRYKEPLLKIQEFLLTNTDEDIPGKDWDEWASKNLLECKNNF